MLKHLANTLLILFFIVYPFLIYWGLNHFEPRTLAFFLFGLLILRYTNTKPSTLQKIKSAWPIGVVVFLTYILGLIFNEHLYLLLTPSIISFSLFGVFVQTLFKPPTFIERFARHDYPVLPPEVITYCRGVTLAWSLCFLMNGCISLWSVFWAPLSFWTLYNGVISYGVLGTLVAVEFICRKLKEPGFKRSLANILAKQDG